MVVQQVYDDRLSEVKLNPSKNEESLLEYCIKHLPLNAGQIRIYVFAFR